MITHSAKREAVARKRADALLPRLARIHIAAPTVAGLVVKRDGGDITLLLAGDTLVTFAGLAVGYWPDLEGLRQNWHRAAQWLPSMDARTRDEEYDNWQRAVERTFDWIKPR